MSKLDELINMLCPDGVEYKTLGDVAELVTKRVLVESLNPTNYVGVENLLQEKKGVEINDKNPAEKNAIVYEEDDILIGNIRPYLRKIWIADRKGCSNADVLTIRILNSFKTQFSAKFLYYILSSENFFIYDIQNSKGAKMPRGSKEAVMKFEIPVPPLEVQNEIVRILDKFTSLEAELEAELEARRKQYEYYRDSLLTFGDDVEWKTLGEIATDIYRGSGIKRDQVTTEGIPCVRYGEIYTSYNIHFNNCISHTIIDNVPSPKYFEHGDILFAITGESVEDIAKSIAYMGNEKCLAGGDIVVLKHNQNPKYLSFALSTNNAIMQKGKGKVKSKVVHSSVPSISEIKIPVPDLETQEKIANILDNFLQLTNDITSGLPAEIEARKKQYEYYRDKLLSFKRKEAV